MGEIRTKQLETLQRYNTENIKFKEYDKDGNYNQLYVENVMIETPTTLRPIDNSIVTEYLRPLKKVSIQVPVKERNFTTEDPTFKYGGHHFTFHNNVNVVASSALNSSSHTSIHGKSSLTGDFCLQDTNAAFKMVAPTANKIQNNLIESVATTADHHKVSSSNEFEVGFSYFVGHDNPTADFYFVTVARVIKNDDSGQFYFHVDKNRWEDFSSTAPSLAQVPFLHFSDRVKNTKTNQWNNYKRKYPPVDDANNFQNKVEFLIYSISYNTTGDRDGHQTVLLDNIFVANCLDYGDNLIIERTQSSDRTLTGVYEVEDIPFCNELNNTVYDNGIEGEYFSRHDGRGNRGSLEEIVSQEYINDYRNFLVKYEGTFYNHNPLPDPVKMFNRVWFNFKYSEETHIDPCTASIDSIVYDVKKNTYEMNLHLPNQDDNIATTFQITYD